MNTDTLERLTRAELAQLAREYMLAAQFNSRTGYAALRINHGDEAYKDVAIDNWMAASPVYTRRMQAAMGLRGRSDVETILKGMQLECGLSHQYFDACFHMVGDEEGEFWLRRCGPLLETEPRGEEAVRLMCHDIEDPTFDATAVATNPRARVRPIHRPPRVPPDREPHCHWRVNIEPGADPVVERDITRAMAASLLASTAIERKPAREPGGLELYDCPVFEQLQMERFSHSALVVICKELAIQVHLLINSLGLAISQRYGDEAARAVAEFQMTGSAWVVSERLARWMGIENGGIEAIADVLRLHPAFQPAGYHAVTIARADDRTLRITLEDCPAAHEQQAPGWYALLLAGKTAGLEALVLGVNPCARLLAVDDSAHAFEVRIGEQPAEESLALRVARGTVLYTTKLENHIQLLEVP